MVLAASVRLCKALDALEGFGGFSSLWQVWKALGSFDVNMVCPLPGSWINHAEKSWETLGGFGFSIVCRLGGFGRCWNVL